MLGTLNDRPLECEDHPHFTPGSGTCVACQIFDAWVVSTKDDGYSIDQLAQLTGIDKVQLRRSESRGRYYRQYGDFPTADET